MLDIEFRGKYTYNNKFVYGYLDYSKKDKSYIIHTGNGVRYFVKPETVGPYIGLEDKNRKKIFLGDIVRGAYIKSSGEVVVISGAIKYALYRFQIWGKYVIDLRDIRDIEVIGNIYDNPELLEV